MLRLAWKQYAHQSLPTFWPRPNYRTRNQHTFEGTTALRLEKIQIPGSDEVLHCDTTTGIARPSVPETPRLKVFDSLHGLVNFGTEQLLNSFLSDTYGRRSEEHLSTCMPVLSAVYDIQAHHHTTG